MIQKVNHGLGQLIVMSIIRIKYATEKVIKYNQKLLLSFNVIWIGVFSAFLKLNSPITCHLTKWFVNSSQP